MRIKADLQLLFVTVIWGAAFVVMRVAAGHHSIFLLNGARFLLGGLVLIPLNRNRGSINRSNLIFIVLAGLALFAGLGLQQAGLETTTAGNAGFITCLYIVIIPIGLWIIWGERPSVISFISIPLALAGGYLLSAGGRFSFRIGDLLIFIGSFFWAMHVIVVGKAQGKIPALPFAIGQFLLCGLLSLLTGAFTERPTIEDWKFLAPPILLTGIFSIALGFTLQVLAQKHTPPNDAALILSMEAVFAALFGWIFLKENLDPLQILGCCLILVAVLMLQLKNGTMKNL